MWRQCGNAQILPEFSRRFWPPGRGLVMPHPELEHHGTKVPFRDMSPYMKRIERTQTGLRLEKRMLKVLKGLAEHFEISTAEIVEAMILHNFEGKTPFSPETLVKIGQLKQVYDLDLTAADAHALNEAGDTA